MPKKFMEFGEFVITLERKIFKKPVTHTDDKGNPNYIHTMFKAAQNIIDFDKRNYLVNCPPRVGKSTYMGIYLIAYGFARYSNCKFLYLHIEENLAREQVRRLKTILESEHYLKLTATRFKNRLVGWKSLETTTGGVLQTLSIGSNVTGLGAGLYDLNKFSGAIIFDEPHQAIDYAHPAKVREVIERFFKNVITRRQTVNVPFIIIGHRISNVDLFSKLLSPENQKAFNWVHIKIRAIEKGRSIAPNIFSLEYLESVRKRTPEVFEAQYMQAPIWRTDVIYNTALIESNLIEKIKETTTPTRDIIISVDPNGNSKTSADTTAIVAVSMFYDDDKKLKVPHMLIKDIHDQKEPNLAAITSKVLGMILKYKDRLLRVFIESHTFGHALYDAITEMIQLGHLDAPKSLIIPTKRILDKRLFMTRIAFYVHTHLYLNKRELEEGQKYAGLFEEMGSITIDNKNTKDDVTDAISEIAYQVYEQKTVPMYRHIAGDEENKDKYRNRLISLFK